MFVVKIGNQLKSYFLYLKLLNKIYYQPQCKKTKKHSYCSQLDMTANSQYFILFLKSLGGLKILIHFPLLDNSWL